MNSPALHGVLVAITLLPFTIGACKNSPGDTRQPEAPSGTAYKLHRPLKVGQRIKTVTTGGTNIKTLLNGKQMPEMNFNYSYVYDAEHTVKAVQNSGRAGKVAIKIAKLQRTKAGVTKDLLPVGTVVLVTIVEDVGELTVNGKPAPEEAAALLGSMVSSGWHNLDVLFGASSKKAGDTWKLRVPKMLADLKTATDEHFLLPKPADFTDTVTRTKKNEGIEGLQVRVEMKTKKLTPKKFPGKGTMELILSYLVPVDPKLPVTSNISMKIHAVGDLKKDSKEVKIVMETWQNASFK